MSSKFWRGRRKNEFNERWRLLQSFQESVKGVLGDLMDFVDNVDLKPTFGGLVSDILDNLPNLVDTAIGSPVNFVNIHGTPVEDLAALRALVAGVRRRAFLAIEGFGQNTRCRGFPHTPHAGKQIGVGDPARRHSVTQNPCDMILAGDLSKTLRTLSRLARISPAWVW